MQPHTVLGVYANSPSFVCFENMFIAACLTKSIEITYMTTTLYGSPYMIQCIKDFSSKHIILSKVLSLNFIWNFLSSNTPTDSHNG